MNYKNKIMKAIFLAFASLILLPLISTAVSADNCKAIYNYGPSENRVDIVIVGDDWPEDKMNEFASNATLIANELVTNYATYSNYSKLINIWYVNQSADLSCSGYACNNALVTALASQCPYDKIYVLMNDMTYGGTGGSIVAVGTRHLTYIKELFVHELGGHTLGELMDEYNYSGTGPLYYSGANCATPAEADYVDSATPCTKWSTVPGMGCFPGCSYSNLYRPTFSSIMKAFVNPYKWFNAVSQKQIEKVINKYANLTSDYNPKTNPPLKVGQSRVFNVTKVNESDPSTIRWYVNGEEKTASENQTSYTLTPASEGTYTIDVNISYINIKESYSWYDVIATTNHAPEITSYAPADTDVNVNENSSLKFNMTVTDSDLDALTYSWKLDGVEKATTQNWTYTPTFDDAGQYNVTVTVSDSMSTASHYWNVSVNNVNRAPVISSSPVTAGMEGQVYAYNVIASDPDGDAISYSLVTAPAGMSINSTGSIAWTPNSDQSGMNAVKVMVNDSTLNSTQEFNVSVDYINDAPVLDAIADKTVDENSQLKFNITAADADLQYGDSLTYSVNSTLTVVKINNTLAEVSWTPSYNDAGVHYFALKAKDSDDAEDIETVKITVNNVNRAPVISSSPVTAGMEGQLYTYNVVASDPDGDAISYSLVTSPAGMSINSTGSITWTPNSGQIGINAVKVQVNDSTLNSTQEFNVSVDYINDAPVLDAIADKTVDENSQLKFNITAADADLQYGDSLTYSVNSTLTVVKINNTLAEVSWTPSYDNAGVHYFALKAKDSDDAEDIETVKITVNNVNRAPVLDNIADITSYEGETITIAPHAVDLDAGDIVTYSYSGWMTSASRATDYDDAGAYTVNVTATDGILSDSKMANIIVLNSYRFMTAVSDRLTKDRLDGTATINGVAKSISTIAPADFSYVHSNTEYSITYSSSGYQNDNYPLYLDNGLTGCTAGADCSFGGTYTTTCRWNAGGYWICTVTNAGWSLPSTFTFDKTQNTIKRIDYLVK